VRKAREPEERAVVGLDLSLRASAAVWLPRGWAPGDWGRIAAETFDAEAEGEVGSRRICLITWAVRGFVEEVWRRDPSAFPRVAMEQYAFSRNGAHASEIRELGGAVKFTMREKHRAPVESIVASSARKTLLGPLPRMSRKEWKAHLKHELARMGCPLDDEDQRDALVVANRLRHDLGLSCLSVG
jgi:hypothetical protein